MHTIFSLNAISIDMTRYFKDIVLGTYLDQEKMDDVIERGKR